MTRAVCFDQKRPVPIEQPHGPWWLTVRVPLGRQRHLYVGAATQPRFASELYMLRDCRVLVDRGRLLVLVMPHRFWGGRHIRGWVMLHRFCAHVDVRESA